MGTCSYVLTGTEKGMIETFGSTCHGAGRGKRSGVVFLICVRVDVRVCTSVDVRLSKCMFVCGMCYVYVYVSIVQCILCSVSTCGCR